MFLCFSLAGMSAREAAAMYCIHRSTIGDKICGISVPHLTKKGKEPLIDKAVKDRYVNVHISRQPRSQGFFSLLNIETEEALGTRLISG